MRLIDADELIKDRVENDPVRIAAMCAPTAYDVEAVSKALKNEMEFVVNEHPCKGDILRKIVRLKFTFWCYSTKVTGKAQTETSEGEGRIFGEE
ncbi:MAG: hypothetical protein ACLUUO_18690 [Sellimonas intestinalis]